MQHRDRDAYRRFHVDASHPGLQFKRLHASLPIWSVRISDTYRAVGVRKNDAEIVWFFIGTHAEYDNCWRSSEVVHALALVGERKLRLPLLARYRARAGSPALLAGVVAASSSSALP